MREENPARKRSPLTPLAEASEITASAIEESVADETEILWLENLTRSIALGLDQSRRADRVARSATVRVRQGGRNGSYRIGRPERGMVALAIRHAIADAHLSAPVHSPPLPGPDEPEPRSRAPYDRDLALLTDRGARALLSAHALTDEAAILDWCEGTVIVHNSHGLMRRARTTAVTVQVRSGAGPSGAGFFVQSARRLEDLDIAHAFERARRRRARGTTTAPPPARDIPLLLSAEATIELVNQLEFHALSGRAYRRGTSFLREHLGVQVFDRHFSLLDDGTDPRAMPFPFDLEGRTKRPVALVKTGVPKTPTVDTRTAWELGIEPTGHCAGAEEGRGLNLFMAPGELGRQELLHLADGGLWIGRLEEVEVFDPGRMTLRAHCRGVRRIENGSIGPGVGECIWEDSLLRVFSNLLGVGRDPVVRVSHDGLLGGLSAPPVVIGEAAALTVRCAG